jgi:hypothetical protein
MTTVMRASNSNSLARHFAFVQMCRSRVTDAYGLEIALGKKRVVAIWKVLLLQIIRPCKWGDCLPKALAKSGDLLGFLATLMQQGADLQLNGFRYRVKQRLLLAGDSRS